MCYLRASNPSGDATEGYSIQCYLRANNPSGDSTEGYLIQYVTYELVILAVIRQKVT